MRDKLRMQRKSLGFTQLELSKKVGLTRAAYTNIERGYKNPSFRTAAKIKKVLCYENDDIFLET